MLVAARVVVVVFFERRSSAADCRGRTRPIDRLGAHSRARPAPLGAPLVPVAQCARALHLADTCAAPHRRQLFVCALVWPFADAAAAAWACLAECGFWEPLRFNSGRSALFVSGGQLQLRDTSIIIARPLLRLRPQVRLDSTRLDSTDSDWVPVERVRVGRWATIKTNRRPLRVHFSAPQKPHSANAANEHTNEDQQTSRAEPRFADAAERKYGKCVRTLPTLLLRLQRTKPNRTDPI